MDDDRPRVADHLPLILDPADPEDARILAALRADPHIEFRDLRASLRAERGKMVAAPDIPEGPEADRWIYYPWRAAVVGLPGPRTFRAIRLDRNRNKLTRAEQDRLAERTIGIIGQSAGHAIAHLLALEGVCGGLRLADLDEIELSNLNRVPGTLFDIGVNKAVVTARRIAELDPYLPVQVFEAGVDENSVDEFLDGLAIVVEECDSLDMKLVIREAAARHRILLLMETSDRGLLDVERFDLEPERPAFHGLLGDIRAADLRGLSSREKAPFVVKLLGAAGLSPRLGASLVEVGETVTSWPQLAGDVALGAAGVVAAVRRIGLGTKLDSGRVRVDVERHLDELADPPPNDEPIWAPAPPEPAGGPIESVLACAQRAPSGGNMQPWSLRTRESEISIELAPEHSTAMDIGYRGSAVALGAAVYNARVAAAAHGILGPHEFVEGAPGSGRLLARLRLGNARSADLAADYPAVLRRETNRRVGTGAGLADGVLDALEAVAESAGARVRAVVDRQGIEEAACLLAHSDRIRYLTPRLYEEMLAEVRWPDDDPDTGIDARSLELTDDEWAAFEITTRADVMAQLRSWSGGSALGKYTADRVRSSSAILAVTFGATDPRLTDYAEAGAAVARVWVRAERLGLCVQPISPVYLYARRHAELAAISPDFADTLASLQGRFLDLLEVPEHETMALVLRLSYASAATVRSRRRPVLGVDTSS
ncbi:MULTISPECIES: Rv1355c family protein [Nocardia]|uniref:Rv1355c family protein n=1 Tax=Nocardia abscessus TaxID=120957 RepID=UPI001895DAF0|nr:Rv1355c family protein [Nocardia abscessus]MBF6474939.1 Rv1355c family protein [Nocardia abscessus]